MKTNIYSFVLTLLLLFPAFAAAVAQDVMEVETRGVGVTRDDALQDALRNAVGQAAGVALTSETRVENFMVISDAVETKTSGYISSYNIIKEVPFPDRYEVTVKAKVSLSPLKADIGLLTKSIGGVRFLVMYDYRKIPEADQPRYEYAIERINEYLSGKKYRYIDKNRFDALKKEAQGIMQSSDTPEETYVQRLGLMADAQFIIMIKNITVNSRSEAFDTRTASQVTLEVKAYDNCTAEGLGTVVLESGWKSSSDAASLVNSGVTDAVQKGFDKLLSVFVSYIGSWVNDGTPFELRFYSTGTYRDFRDLRTRMKADQDFGGDMEIVSLENYTKLNVTFRKKPDELADKVLDYADQIPAFAAKVLDVKLIYGRQINFAPQNVNPPELQGLSPQSGKGGTETKTGTTSPSNTGKTSPTKTSTTKTTTKTPAKTTTTKTGTKTK